MQEFSTSATDTSYSDAPMVPRRPIDIFGCVMFSATMLAGIGWVVLPYIERLAGLRAIHATDIYNVIKDTRADAILTGDRFVMAMGEERFNVRIASAKNTGDKKLIVTCTSRGDPAPPTPDGLCGPKETPYVLEAPRYPAYPQPNPGLGGLRVDLPPSA